MHANRQPLGRAGGWLPVLVTGAVAALTLAGVVATDIQARHDARARRASTAANIRAQTLDTVDATIGRTQDLASDLGADWNARGALFASGAAGLLRSPGINGVGLIQPIVAGARGSFERRHGPIEARAAAGRRRPAPARGEYFVVTASVATYGRVTNLGLDVGAYPARRTALLAAATSGRPRATPPVRLMAGEGPPGTVLYSPVYRRPADLAGAGVPALGAHRVLLGLVSTSFRYDLLLRALRRTAPAGTAFALSDGRTQLLAQGHPRAPLRTPIAVAGRTWTLIVGSPSPDFSLPITIGLAGGMLTLLLGVIGVQGTRRERYAQELVARRMAEREVAEGALARAEERFRTAFTQAPIGMALTSLEGRFLQVNRALCRITGHSEQQLLGMAFASELTHPDDRRADRTAVARMRGGEIEIYDAEKRYLHAAGHTVWVAIHTALIRDEHGEPAHFLSQIEDITARRRYELQLQHMADHDSLTGLLNRRAYERRLEEHLLRGERYGHEGAVLVIDLDDFKEVNDTLGHNAGDALIARVARALQERLRESDVLARLGGDEFAILMPAGGRLEAERLARTLLEAVRRERAARGPGGRARPITASIGIAPLASAIGLSAEEALINADLAMYDAKEAGRDRSETYGGPGRGRARIEARLEWVERIRAALDEDRLVLHAQPVVETATGEATQHELLVRMLDPDGDLIQPASFLPIAERFGLIREIDRWVITRAIRMLGEHLQAGRRPTVEINISGHSLGDTELAAHIGEELRATGVRATQLIFEVTETTAIDNIAAARAFAEQLGELGCRFALDDFGAGFGSFYYLKHLPFDFIKIDGEFVRNCTADPHGPPRDRRGRGARARDGKAHDRGVRGRRADAGGVARARRRLCAGLPPRPPGATGELVRRDRAPNLSPQARRANKKDRPAGGRRADQGGNEGGMLLTPHLARDAKNQT